MFIRFLLSGGVNTVATYILYLLLLTFLPYRISYTLAFVIGVILAYGLNRFFVFRISGAVSTVILFPLVYLVQYLAGLGIISIWVELLGWNIQLGPIAAITLTIPLTYLLSKWLFIRRKHA